MKSFSWQKIVIVSWQIHNKNLRQPETEILPRSILREIFACRQIILLKEDGKAIIWHITGTFNVYTIITLRNVSLQDSQFILALKTKTRRCCDQVVRIESFLWNTVVWLQSYRDVSFIFLNNREFLISCYFMLYALGSVLLFKFDNITVFTL